MGCLTVRPITTSVWAAFLVATTLFAAAQGQTPTTPGFRPAPSSGIVWSPSSGNTGQATANTETDGRNSTTRSQLRSAGVVELGEVPIQVLLKQPFARVLPRTRQQTVAPDGMLHPLPLQAAPRPRPSAVRVARVVAPRLPEEKLVLSRQSIRVTTNPS